MMHLIASRIWCVIPALMLAPAVACTPRPAPDSTAALPRRVIVLSLDSFNELRIRSSLPAASTPAIRGVLDDGACASTARPAFPSLTAPGHAALWTGSYGDVNGVAGNVQSRLPREQYRLDETISGFSAATLSAEPIWVTATLAGIRTAGHHTTQSPDVPAYPDTTSGAPDASAISRRARAAAALRNPELWLINGYDDALTDDRVISHATHVVRVVDAEREWAGFSRYEGIDATPLAREVAVALGTHGDSAFVLFIGRGGEYTHALVAGARDVALAVEVRPHPADTTSIRGRELARHFSPPVTVRVARETVRTHVRLFELARDGERFMLFMPALSALAANHESARLGYAGAIGWVGNSAGGLLASGAFGPSLEAGGDGTAEQRWLETAELATRTSIAGAQWMWHSLSPQLMLDYFAIGDDTDHSFYGLVSPATPRFDPALARRVQAVRAHAWSLVDARVAAVRELARASDATLFLSGDHGMRAYWRYFRPNAALAQAGLLAVDGAGRADLTRSRAISPNGYWVSVNRRAWRNGTVTPREEAAVIDSVVRVLEHVRGSDGHAVVANIYRTSQHDSLGLGGPVGGDVYFELARGYYYNSALTGSVTSDDFPARGGHGYPSVSADMQTVLCATGPEFGARRIGAVRTIDLTPTVLEWLGVRPAPSMRGRSLVSELR